MGPARPGPLAILQALSWTCFITLGLWFGLSLVFAKFANRANDIVLLGLTQIAVYALVLAWFGWVRQTELVELLALRSTTLTLGLVYGLVAVRSRSAVPSIVAHFINNGMAVLASRQMLQGVFMVMVTRPLLAIGCALGVTLLGIALILRGSRS